MNNYIINPAVFYWMNVVSVLQTALAVLGGFALAGFIILAVTYAYNMYSMSEPTAPENASSRYEMQSYERDKKAYAKSRKWLSMIRKWMITTGCIGIAFVVISMFLPSKQTSVEMMVARTATFDNVNWTVQQVKEVIDYIVSALKGAV